MSSRQEESLAAFILAIVPMVLGVTLLVLPDVIWQLGAGALAAAIMFITYFWLRRRIRRQRGSDGRLEASVGMAVIGSPGASISRNRVKGFDAGYLVADSAESEIHGNRAE